MAYTDDPVVPSAHSSRSDNVQTEVAPTATSRAQRAASPFPPVSNPIADEQGREPTVATLVLSDGSAYQGVSFGSQSRSVAGECVFQTGMVGYPESLTDPSYRGQILVLTFPLVGNYGVPSRTEMTEWADSIPKYFESSKIHVAALVVGQYSGDHSHYLASSSLSVWLKENDVPAIFGVDTRAITKSIREKGVLLAKVLFPISVVGPGRVTAPDHRSPALNGLTATDCESASLSRDTSYTSSWMRDLSNVDWHDPNERNLVAEVSVKSPTTYPPMNANTAIRGPDGKILRIMAVDVGMKNNQIRCFLKRGVELIVVPWDYDFAKDQNYDGLFVSNGPGDPATVTPTITHLRQLLQMQTKPVFGICLGHQLLALAAGAKTAKLKFGNRGHNIPCTDSRTGRCYITSQNHGYAVDVASLPQGWEPTFTNANDESNEGIGHTGLPYFSVQFHPESTPGPWDTEFLFDEFIESVLECKRAGKLIRRKTLARPPHPVREHPRKVLVLGSGGLSIGQAGEFDYSGSQAIKALKEEGIYTILINPNIATIQTSSGLADKVYFLPVTPDFVRMVIKHEKPDGIYCTFGGQTALNVGVKLKDELHGLGVKVLGTPISAIEITEDRELFAKKMLEIGERCATSATATSVSEAVQAARNIGYPVIVRAAYALGGLGSGFASDEEQLIELTTRSFATSPQVLVEKSMKGWKEIEYEVVRDAADNCITVCNMENFDPLGIHTGDSIVVAPSQTLSDDDYMMLRRTAVNVIRHLGVIGECNIQYALNPLSREYCIIEVNARLSRSSALASKATGYPLAFVAAKLGLGIPLTEVRNSVTKKTIACFEPSLDYCVVKIPRWDLKKFSRVSTKISSAMKSVGEVMSIGRTFEETIQKAIRAVDYHFIGFSQNDYVQAIDDELRNPSDQRVFAIANALHLGYSVDKIHEMTSIDRWFLNKLKCIVEIDKKLSNYTPQTLPRNLLAHAKQMGFSDRQVAKAVGTSELALRKLRIDQGLTPFVKQIDTVAAEFPCYTNYLYVTYNASEHDVAFNDKGIMVLGSGVYRIGSSVEFDWCAVRCIRTLRSLNYKTIMINYNPETVSTDYDEADRLYFETLTLERVLDIYELEKSDGVVVSMGGQTPNNIALPLFRENVKILGTTPEMIDNAENRYKFSRMLDKIGVDQPLWKELTSMEDAKTFCAKVGYPVLVRPSYVLSGAAMNVVYSEQDLFQYLQLAVNVSRDFPVVISKFIEEAKEIEMDAVASGGKLVMHVISEHVENAGVHSGDATLVQPPQDLDPETVRKIEVATRKIANALNVTGPLNIQFIAKNNEIKVIECNVRASRSFPFVSKVLGVDLIELATKAIVDEPFEAYPPVEDRKDYVGVKVPQFSFSRLSGADPILGVEMASTGEVACFGKDKYEAYLKGLLATGFVLPKKNILLSIGAYKEKAEFLPSARKLHQMGFKLFATSGTADFLQEHDIPVKYLEALDDEDSQKTEYSLTAHLATHLIDLYINLPSKNQFRRPASYMSRGYRSRRMAVDFAIPLITNVKCAKLFVEALSRHKEFEISSVDYKTSHKTIILPGLISIQTFIPNIATPDTSEFALACRSALAGGFTMLCLMPQGGVLADSLKDKRTLAVAQGNCRAKALCDYALSVGASRENSALLDGISADTTSLFVTFDAEKCPTLALAGTGDLAAHFRNWPKELPIVASARDSALASVLFLANIHSRSVHITNVYKHDDLSLIMLAKEKGVNVTCDVAVHNLFFTNEDLNSPLLGTPQDVEALWDHLAFIDCFSIGPLLSYLKGEGKTKYTQGLEEGLPLLLTAVSQGRLTMEDIASRMHHNPRAIFDLPEQPETYIEVEVERRRGGVVELGQRELPVDGVVHRVVFRGETVFLDGSVFGHASGRDVTGAVRILGKGGAVSNSRRGTTHRPSLYATAPDQSPNALMEALTPKSPRGRLMSREESTLSTIIASRQAMAIGETANAFATVAGTARTPQDVAAAAMKNWLTSPASVTKDGLSDGVVGTQFPGEGPLETGPAAVAMANVSKALQRTYQQTLDVAQTQYISELPRSLSSVVTKSPFYRKHVLSVKQYGRPDLHTLFGAASELRILIEKQGTIPLLAGKVMCSAFYEASTRTSSSFEAAMLRLGGSVVGINQITSSVTKGESLADTVRTLSCYGDAIVMRHPEVGSAATAAKFSPVPIINAGDGTGEHPTQAFLDVYTIREELGTVNGLTITMVGDLKNGRTVHSLARLLCNYDVKINYVSPASLGMPDEVKAEIRRAGIKHQYETTSLDEVIGETDVLYVTRIQKERFSDLSEYEKVLGAYIITTKVLQRAKPQSIVMHPLPRVNEIDQEVDFDQRAAYFRQMKYGLYVRAALLALVLGRS
ncbi:hypothetical protein SeMB42_g02766 [Synchytrium endobioticum]|uniref:Uncharacterized protein n=1 Tax=Synchytrium endobioticum TaxID=286115 RepID=A0A507CSZ8_9FUNG|nr:hypothetical protein SeLEV6574_g05701 [Synchytrium endobioticum]TPX48994.1 hypothetical protein SeMB42_g02766 [Synchytrium endobioticum]